MKIGCIGLGSLGHAIAERLIQTDYDITVWNRTRSKADDLKVPIATSPKSLAESVDVILINLFDSNAVKDAAQRSDGLLAADLKDKLVIDTTTQFVDDATELHKMFGNAGAAYVEAPIFGSVAPTLSGTVTIVASGTKDAYDRAKPILDRLGKHIFHFAEPSTATRMKLVNNLILGAFMTTIAEGVTIAEAAGISRETALDVLAVGAGNSAILNGKKQKLIDRDYAVHFSSDAIHKDLTGLLQLADKYQQPATMAVAARDLFQKIRNERKGDEDLSGVIRVMEPKR